jgi:hypothetical protein
MDAKAWSIYGAERSQPVATGGKWDCPENGSNKPRPLPWVATSCWARGSCERGAPVARRNAGTPRAEMKCRGRKPRPSALRESGSIDEPVQCRLPPSQAANQEARTASGGEPLRTVPSGLPCQGLGTGLGERFELSRGGSGVFEERLRRADEVPKLQGKHMDSALSPAPAAADRILHGKKGVDGSSPSEGLAGSRMVPEVARQPVVGRGVGCRHVMETIWKRDRLAMQCQDRSVVITPTGKLRRLGRL